MKSQNHFGKCSGEENRSNLRKKNLLREALFSCQLERGFVKALGTAVSTKPQVGMKGPAVLKPIYTDYSLLQPQM